MELCASWRLCEWILGCMSQHLPSPTDIPLGQAPIPMPEEDGNYTCDLCHQSIRVGDGGNKNFFQHHGSPGCLRAAKKIASTAKQAAKTVTITLFFSKATKRIPTSAAGSARGAPSFPPIPPPLLIHCTNLVIKWQLWHCQQVIGPLHILTHMQSRFWIAWTVQHEICHHIFRSVMPTMGVCLT
jgi:hypothetical protein